MFLTQPLLTHKLGRGSSLLRGRSEISSSSLISPPLIPLGSGLVTAVWCKSPYSSLNFLWLYFRRVGDMQFFTAGWGWVQFLGAHMISIGQASYLFSGDKSLTLYVIFSDTILAGGGSLAGQKSRLPTQSLPVWLGVRPQFFPVVLGWSKTFVKIFYLARLPHSWSFFWREQALLEIFCLFVWAS